MSQTICLAMMVKNEAHVLARCLASVRPFVTHWVISDTGSTDRTREVAREAMGDLPGEVVDTPWKNFGWNRTESVRLARPRADYTLIIDADDMLEYPPGAKLPPLVEPGYAMRIVDGGLVYFRILVFSNAHPWRFEGVRHEYAQCDGVDVAHPALLDGIVYRRHLDGARATDPRKYLDDAADLEADLQRNPADARSVFYLARSYDDAGEHARALANYERRAFMGGWDEEVFYALLGAARMRARLGAAPAQVEQAYLAAWGSRPSRAEPLAELARVTRIAGDPGRAYAFARAAVATPLPVGDTLFVHADVYAWRALDEAAVAAAQIGDFPAAIEANRRILATAQALLPPDDRARIESNLAMCERAFGPAGPAGPGPR